MTSGAEIGADSARGVPLLEARGLSKRFQVGQALSREGRRTVSAVDDV